MKEKKKKRKRKLKDIIPINRSLLIILLVVLVLLLVFFFRGFIGDLFVGNEELEVCGDGSFYNTCSLNKPYYCEEGILIEKASICGCLEEMKKDGDFLVQL